MSRAGFATGTEQRTDRPQAIAVGILLALCTFVLSVLAHPPHRFGLLALVAYVPMILAQHLVLPKRSAGVALAIGIAGPAWWGLHQAIPGRAVAALTVGPIVLALALLGLGYLDRTLMEATRYRYFVFAVPFAWTSLAYLLSNGPLGTIGQGASALHAYPALIQPVSVVGSIGLILLILLSNWAVAALALAALRHPNFPARRALRIVATTIAVAIVWTASSLVLLDRPTPTVRVAAIQPGPRFRPGPQAVLTPRAMIDRYASATRVAVRRGAQLVVWPEGALSFDPTRQESSRLRELARDTGTSIVTGYSVFAPGTVRNEAILVTPDGRFLGPYSKQHPVTFLGERSDSDHGYPTFDTRLGKVAMLICYDLDYMDTPRRMARQGAGLIAVPSNDWSKIANVHYPSFVLRAVENRTTLVKADTAWDSVIVDPYGRVVAKRIDEKGGAGILVASVPIGSTHTIAASIGDLNAAAAAVIALFLLSLLIVGTVRSSAPADG